MRSRVEGYKELGEGLRIRRIVLMDRKRKKELRARKKKINRGRCRNINGATEKER